MKRPFDILDDVRVATPCRADWNTMTGDARARHCALCNKNVYDLSAMTSAQAKEFVETREGKTCVRFFRRGDGTMLTADCPVGLARVRRRMAISFAAAVGFVASLASLGAFAMTAKSRCHGGGGGIESGAMQTIYNWVATVWGGPPAQPQMMLGEMVPMTPITQTTPVPATGNGGGTASTATSSVP